MSTSPIRFLTPAELLESRPDMSVSASNLEAVINSSLAFNAYEGPSKKEYLDLQQTDFVRTVSGIPGYMATFGTGHPFYATEGDVVRSIDEIEAFTEGFRPAIDAEKTNQFGTWPCAACVEVNNLPDLKQVCRPCDRVTLKPRDIFKFMPDVDYWVVVDDLETSPEEVAPLVANKIEDAGFYNSDGGISFVLNKALEAMDGIVAGEVPDARLPVDLHVVTAKELVAVIMNTPGSLLGKPANISPLSWHRKWERSEEYDFLKDFVFSFTMLHNTSAGLDGVIRLVRQYMNRQIGDPVELISKIAPKEGRQLKTPALARILRERVDSWQA